MYLLTAVFNRTSLNDVLTELHDKKIEGLTVSSVIGKGGLGFIEPNGKVDLDEKVRLDIVISNDAYKESAKEAIRSNTQDLGHGAGKMWVTPVVEVERIRTGEVNEAALTHSSEKAKVIHNHDTVFCHDDTPSS